MASNCLFYGSLDREVRTLRNQTIAPDHRRKADRDGLSSSNGTLRNLPLDVLVDLGANSSEHIRTVTTDGARRPLKRRDDVLRLGQLFELVQLSPRYPDQLSR